jgi:hypothetical protein
MHSPDPWSRSERRALAALLLLGCALRLVQWLHDPAQWFDEGMLSQSLVERSATELLTRPLFFNQSAPPGYLLLERLCVVLFGAHDLVLRLVPFVGSIVTLFACVPLARHAIFGAGRIVAVGLVALAAPLILYVGQAKQYSSEVAVSILLLLLGQALLRALSQADTARARPLSLKLGIVASVGGAASVWLSLSATLTLIAVALVLLLAILRGRSLASAARLFVPLSPVFVIWSASALLAALYNRHTGTPYMLHELLAHWEGASPPAPPPWSATLVWPLKALSRLFRGTESAGLYYPLRPVFLLLSAAGLVTLARRSVNQALLLGLPLAVTLTAAALHQYPFGDRLTMFLIPSLLCLIAEGAGQLTYYAARWQPRLAWAVPWATLGLAAVPIVQTPPPYHSENLKPLLEQLQRERKPSDVLYVYYAAMPAYHQYVVQGLAPAQFAEGICHREDSRSYFHDLDRLRGSARVWVLITHALPKYLELEDFTAYLNAIGTQKSARVVEGRGPAGSANVPLPAILYLYDLSDPAKAAAVSPHTFPLRGPMGGNTAALCE